jgi:hypothetical protein
MATLKVKNVSGKDAGTVELDDDVFAVQPNVPVMHQVVTAQLAARRSGTQSTKTRAEVRGGGRKPYAQKGIVAEQHDQVGLELIGLAHDRTDALDVHPGLAGVDVGNRRDRDGKVAGPARKLQIIAGDALAQQRLDDNRIGRRRGADDTERKQPLQETTS